MIRNQNKVKKWICAATLLVMCLSLLACGTTPEATQAPTNAPSSGGATAAPSAAPTDGGDTGDGTGLLDPWKPSDGPLVDTLTTYTAFTQVGGSTVEEIVSNQFTAWYEEKTNIHIEWDVVTTGASTQIPLLIAADTLPDFFFGGNISDSNLAMWAILDKVFVPIEDSVYRMAPNIVKMYEESASARQYQYLPDGHMYSLLRVVDTYNERVTKRAWVYEPWLTALNIDMPQTTEDFYNMLVQFRDGDPTGTGVEVVPFSGALLNNPANNEPESYILNSFIYYEGGTFLEVLADGKTISFVGFDEQYREGLRYLNKLYKEKLLAEDTWTIDRTGLRQMTEGGDVNTVGVVSAMYWGHFTVENGPTGRDKEFVSLPVLEGPQGVRNAYDRGMLVNNGKMVITKECENVDLIIRWADYFFDPDAMMEAEYAVNYGPVDLGWTWAAPGELNVNGEQAKYKHLRAVDSKQNDNWFMTEPYYESREFINSFVNDDMNRKEAFGGAETTKNYMPYSAFDKKVPFMFLPLDNLDEAAALKDRFTNTTTGELNIYRNKFITGELSLDNDWDAYVSQMQNLGIQNYIDLYQGMYDSYLAIQAGN